MERCNVCGDPATITLYDMTSTSSTMVPSRVIGHVCQKHSPIKLTAVLPIMQSEPDTQETEASESGSR